MEPKNKKLLEDKLDYRLPRVALKKKHVELIEKEAEKIDMQLTPFVRKLILMGLQEYMNVDTI